MSDATQEGTNDSATAASNEAPPRRRPAPFTPAQAVVATLLGLGLMFIVVSNYAGWTAKVRVNAVQRDCARAECKQRVFVDGRKQPFSVEGDRTVAVGDLAEIHGQCTPRCKLELVSFSKSSVPD